MADEKNLDSSETPDESTPVASSEDQVETPAPSRRPRSSRPVRKAAASAEDPEPIELADDEASLEPVRKGRPTPRQKDAIKPVTETRRTGPGQFVKESVAELGKVVWPTSSMVGQYFAVVLVFVTFIIALVSLLDLGFGWALLKLFG